MNYFFMAQSFSSQVLILLKKFGEEIQILLDGQPSNQSPVCLLDIGKGIMLRASVE